MPSVITPCGGGCSGTIDSTATAGSACGVHSAGATSGDVLTSDGASGSLWSPPAASGSAYSARVLATSGLVAAWPFDDASGNAVDASGNGNDLAPVGTPTYLEPGPFTDSDATSILLDGIDGFGLTNRDQFQGQTNLNVFNGTSSFTLEMLVMPTDAANAGAMFWYFGGGGDAVSLSFGGPGGAGTGTVPTCARGATNVSSNAALPLTRWAHVACTYDGATLSIYVDGALMSSAASAAISTVGTTDFYAGRIGDGSGSVHYLRSYIAWGALYNVALSAATIAAHAAANISAGSDAVTVKTVTAAYQALTSDAVVLAAGTFTVTLPAAGAATGQVLTIKNNGAGTITIGRTGADTIDGAASNITMATTEQARTLVSNGAGWWVTGAYL